MCAIEAHQTGVKFEGDPKECCPMLPWMEIGLGKWKCTLLDVHFHFHIVEKLRFWRTQARAGT